MLAKKTLELNPHHSAIKQMLDRLKKNDNIMDEETEDLARVMYHMALINSGFNIDKPSEFTSPLQKLINVGFGLDREEPVEEIEVELDDETPDEASKDDDVEEINLDGTEG